MDSHSPGALPHRLGEETRVDVGIDLTDRIEVANKKRECKRATHEGHSGVGVRETGYSWEERDNGTGRVWALAGASGDSQGPC